MQAVPSLVGTGTAAAAAAAGLVFAQQPANNQPLQHPSRPASSRPIPPRKSNRSNSTTSYPPSASRTPLTRPPAKSVSYASTMAFDDRLRNVSNGSSNTASSSSSTRPPHHAPSESSVAPSSTATIPRSIMSKGDWAQPAISEVSRDSMSSTGSWIRRLSSIRPLSQHGSIRSSLGPDSHSFSFSNSAPFSSQLSSTPPQQQQRNKLVKRITSGQDANGVSLSRRGSRSHMPTLRRPATSHQRSATLHQIPQSDDKSIASDVTRPKYSFEQRPRPNLAIFRPGAETPEPNDEADLDEPKKEKRWTSFFHGRISRAGAVRSSVPFSNESTQSNQSSPGGSYYPLPSRTIQAQSGNQAVPYLTHASVLLKPDPGYAAPSLSVPVAAPASVPASAVPIPAPAPAPAYAHAPGLASPFQSPIASRTARKAAEENGHEYSASPSSSSASPGDNLSGKARRSIAMNFSSPTTWITRTGSIRRPKRGERGDANNNNNLNFNATTSGSPRSTALPPSVTSSPAAASAIPATATSGKRHVSAPLSGSLSMSRPSSGQGHYQFQARSITAPDLQFEELATDGRGGLLPSHFDAKPILSTRQRNVSSPLPPLSRLSSFNVERASGHRSGSGPPGFATLPRSFPLVPRNRDISDERSSTLASSDAEFRGFNSSIDDDDTDFKSDTVFDSVRTAASTSTRVRSTDTPIESMFDESPPSTAGNGNSKTKRLSIQEILGHSRDSDTRIMEEEDEGFSTPIRPVTIQPERTLSPSSVLRGFDFSDTGYQKPRQFDDIDAEADVNLSHVNSADIDYSRPSMDDDDDDDDWARIDDSGVMNHLSPPSLALQSSLRGLNGFMFSNSNDENYGQNRSSLQPPRSPLSLISGNGAAAESVDFYDDFSASGRDRPRSNLFDWSESSVNLDKIEADGHSPRPKTVHGKQELDLRNGRPPNRKGPTVAHVRSQSVPVNADPAENTKPSTSKFGTWASGPKNASEDWDDDFDFGTSCNGDVGADNDFGGFESDDADAFGQPATLRSSKGPSSSFKMIVPASIQATQPTVKAHSGQIRELSLLVNGLKRLCRHARDLDIVDESPSLWKEAENIIALASPDEDISEAATAKTNNTVTATIEEDVEVPRTSIEFDVADNQSDNDIDAGDDRFANDSFNGFDDDPFSATDVVPKEPSTPPRFDMSKTGVVRERHGARRRSVFSPDDDIFGGSGWPLTSDKSSAKSPSKSSAKSPAKSPAMYDKLVSMELSRPQTPDRFTTTTDTPDSAMIESIMLAMQQQRSSSAPIRKSPIKQISTSELFFNTNTLQELVKRANTLFHTLSDLVRRAELFTQSPAVTPRHDRLNRCEDGSPAFTRVFTDPSSPSKRLPKSHSNNSVVARGSPSVESPSTNRVSQRLQMMTVS
ncbi:hypothetical protein F503_02001 [Ophiostoma piceae UAMH 11346]|uniref:Uncharacterized protein n=1 Tax=Ophiostoma piceae (strain UAMH 11346) TaxID=1262450 RepID=S3CAL2_OPHP1|nr:hypothetical protein F503_02001 [Ophiostoma piceae UAMH 11346]